MSQIYYDREILYVYKIYFFLLLWSLSLALGGITFLRFGRLPGLCLFVICTLLSYLAMVRKKEFPPPDRKLTAQRMAREITQDTSPLAISRFASQLYFYLHETQQAINLLEKYLPSLDPLLCATLADILLREGLHRQALSVLRDNPYTLADPLLLATQGRILQQINRYPEAVKIYERSLRLSQKIGFPHNGAPWFTQILLSLSYKASLHHSLADCYIQLKDYRLAKKHIWAGNLRLFDLSLWKKVRLSHNNSARNYIKSH
ncbi:tetratricopeptide repeat protein [Desulfitobacterium sp.]|uniref:tetratricopeptide repeat protein n=1 Tax=Desulfitobacterium sp. TaxID=49981 RepID=UPI002CE6B119|nr:tetratricopeptide repeat protein [Desulfitobacterium sp.]HVJ49501.1 tetratricopeptide repeat protein [Desulfitobacterium sp.]